MIDTQLTTLTPQPPTHWWQIELLHDPRLRSPQSKEQYAHVLGKFEAWRSGAPLNVTTLETYLSHLQQQGKGAASVKQALAAIRWLAGRAIKVAYEQYNPDEAEIIEKDLRRLLEVPAPRFPEPLPAGRHLENDELAALLRACDDGTLAGLRDAALLAIVEACGPRNAELRALKLRDVQYQPQGAGAEITIRHGKGDKPRVVDIFGEHLRRLTKWIEARGLEGESLFVRIRKGEQIDPRTPLSYAGTVKILRKRFLDSALPQSLTWHDFRRTVIGNLLNANVDPATIMDISGHAQFQTVKRYDRRPVEARKQALKAYQESLSQKGK